MAIRDALIPEYEMELKNTRKMLERVPLENADWKPHGKSMSLGRLAVHVAEIPHWMTNTITTDELDFAKGDYTPKVFNSTDDILALHDKHIVQADKILNEVSETEFEKPWTMRSGEAIYFTMPKSQVVRTWCMNHLYHHRAQLGVYLRLLDVPLPGTYGPTADVQG